MKYLRVSLQFGAAAAAMIVLYFLALQYWIGDNALVNMSRLDIVIMLVCILFAMGYYRDRRQGGMLHFWQGAIIGIEVNLIGTLLACLAIYLIVSFLAPDILTGFVQLMRQNIQAELQTEAVRKSAVQQAALKAQLANLPYLTPFNMVFFPGGIFIKNFVISLLVTGMVAALMRKNVSHI